MSSKEGDLYQALYKAYQKANPKMTGTDVQQNVIRLWQKTKEHKKSRYSEKEAVVYQMISELESQIEPVKIKEK